MDTPGTTVAATWPIPPAAGCAAGAMPGTDVRETVRLLVGETPDAPGLPLLPSRGAGADPVGRTAALLAGVESAFAVTTTPSGWRLAGVVGRDVRRAAAWLGEDLDALEEAAAGAGVVVLPLIGPWTLAASIELAGGERVLRDAGACRDVADALAVAAVEHVGDSRRRLPGAAVVVRLDEPSLPAVTAGAVPTASGWARYRAVDTPVVSDALRRVVAALEVAGAVVVVAVPGSQVPYDVLHRSGAHGLGVDLTVHPRERDDDLGEAVDAGIALVAGVVDARAAGPDTRPGAAAAAAATALLDPARRLGIPQDTWTRRLVVAPTTGLADQSEDRVRAVLVALRETGRHVTDASVRADD